MRLGTDKLGLLGVLTVVLIATISSLLEDRSAPGPARSGETSVRRPPPGRASADLVGVPEFSIAVGDKKDSSGTAFAIADGVWMTARHVVDGCDVVGVLERPGRGMRARSYDIHSNADVAVMRINRSAPMVQINDAAPSLGDIAYHVGFPRGEPGELRSRMLGVQVMNAYGRYSTREPVIAWAEIDRYPDDSRPLSGLSGGPVFDDQGRLIGVHVAGSVRRGRSYTAHPASIREMMAQAGVVPSERGRPLSFTPQTLPQVADVLRGNGTVVKALCDVR